MIIFFLFNFPNITYPEKKNIHPRSSTVLPWKISVGRQTFPFWGKRPIFKDKFGVKLQGGVLKKRVFRAQTFHPSFPFSMYFQLNCMNPNQLLPVVTLLDCFKWPFQGVTMTSIWGINRSRRKNWSWLFIVRSVDPLPLFPSNRG